MSDKTEHLQMIQLVIVRMAANSFFLKGWSVTLVSSLFALAADKANVNFAYLAVYPCFMFWALDGYFLHQERLYRGLYNQVRVLNESAVDFSMRTNPTEDDKGWVGACLSRTLLLFHGALVVSIIVVIMLLPKH